MFTYNGIKIFYFSGTGNAKRVSLWIREFAADKNIDCQLENIAEIHTNENLNLNPQTLIIIISPIHGFNYPEITLDFIRRFPKGRNGIMLMNTRAGLKIGKFVTPGLTGIAFLLSSAILKSKGYNIVGMIPFDMLSNWLSIHPALSQKAVKFLHRKNYSRTKGYSDEIFEGKKVFTAYKDIVQDILISPVAFVYYFAGRFYLAKSYYASVDCDSCGLCIKQCPVRAIKGVNKRPFWTFKCESCMRCMANCPKKAVETPHGLFVMIGIICSTFGSYLFYKLFPFPIEPGFIKIILYSVFFFILLWIFYIIQHLLLKNRYIGKVISLMSLTHYKFWGRYRSIPDEEWKR
ncbi:ferredoxin/flavodoxin [Dysgonomonas hofstadii]|uniref:Ferredoxin/flavodoxin n=1 Tax=Dysgonomonas hofstadii TaxID=637886 RepID=A0A840CH49_9BACT|nr:EFR1 family ferrodoxin [Dysgonomonas hofstadii]MBB4034586.1 ferredoxin/flavodoxin [Dysgonomonas hofstadii]